MKGFGEIYKITCLVNRKLYFGQTIIGYLERFKQHIKESCEAEEKDNYAIHNAIRKYGVKNFNIEVVCTCPVELLNKMEIFYIAKFKTNLCRYGYEYGYNLTDGGYGMRGYKHTQEQKEKLSEYHKKYYKEHPEVKERLSEAGRNKIYSEETKKKMSEGQKKFYAENPEEKEKISERNKGKNNPMFGVHLIVSKKTRQKMSKSLKKYYKEHPMSEETKKNLKNTFQPGHEVSEETRKKLSKANKGKSMKPFTEEHKKNMSEAQKKRREK